MSNPGKAGVRAAAFAAALVVLMALSTLAGWAFARSALGDRADPAGFVFALAALVIALALAGCVLVALLRLPRQTASSGNPMHGAPAAAGDSRISALETALAERSAQLEAADRELAAFTYSVSHDLKAPLRHISGYVQLLAAATEGALDEEKRRYMTIVSEASRQLGALIDDLLSFSRLTRVEPHLQRLDPREIVDAIVADMHAAVEGRNIEWRISDMPPVHADRAMLGIVYDRLIANAVKYSAPRDPAIIEIGADGEEAGRPVLYVRDNGVGFDMAYAERLFGIFQQLHRAEDFGGTGIGLATVQRLATRHGGRVWAHAAPDAGATFRFTLGKSADAPTHATV